MSNEYLYEWFVELSESLAYLKRNAVDLERIDVFDLQEYIDLAKKQKAAPSIDIYKNTLRAGRMIRALIRNPNTGQRHWFIFPLYFEKLMAIGCSGNGNNLVEIVAIEGTNRFSTGYYTVEELEELNHFAKRYYLREGIID